MSLFKTKKAPNSRLIEVPVLVRFWSEDGVWNASAMDIPVAVFGDTFEEARTHFEGALDSHFEILCERHRLDKTVEHLLHAAKQRGFYDRIPPRQTFEKFLFTPQEPCLAHV